MDIEAMVWGVAATAIGIISICIFCLLKMASVADDKEEEMLRKEGYYGED